jgi:hypothetical protein
MVLSSSGVVIVNQSSVRYIVFVIGLFVGLTFTFGCRRWRDARSGRLPNESAPFIGFAEELERSERVAGMTLDAEHLRDDL